jgi:hypothetical protein
MHDAPNYRPVPTDAPGYSSNSQWTRWPDAAAAIEIFTFEVPTNPALLRMALKDLISFKALVFTTGEQTCIIWDSGASILVTPSMEDFVGPFSTSTLHNELNTVIIISFAKIKKNTFLVL